LVFVQQLAVFLLERLRAMVLLLMVDVVEDNMEDNLAEGLGHGVFRRERLTVTSTAPV
jgi:hypothetical protein